MSHQSGLTGLAVPASVTDYYDWEKITGLLAAQEPLFPPGTASGYQAITFGYLVGEVIRRIAGQSLRAADRGRDRRAAERRLPPRARRGGPGPVR